MTDVVFHELTKRFGDVLVLDNVSLTARAGHVTGLIGPTGSGRTTALRILLGAIAPTAGIATVGGRAYIDLSRPAHAVGAALGTDAFHLARSGRRHLQMHAAINVVRRSRMDEVLELVGLTHAADRAVREYSMDMRQRLGLAVALLTDPAVLVLDEPFNGLDPRGARWLQGLLRCLADEGRTVLVSGHEKTDLRHIADELAILSGGRLVTNESIAPDVHGRLDYRRPRSDDPTPVLARRTGSHLVCHEGATRGVQIERPNPLHDRASRARRGSTALTRRRAACQV